MTILAIDQGTTSSRCILFSEGGEIVAKSQQELETHYPQSGWVEQNPEHIWQTVLHTMQQVITQCQLPIENITACGITNQRETTLIWDRRTGETIYPAIVWQDRRTAKNCQALIAQGLETKIQQKTGLLLDPYFSATKIAWILDNVPNARARARAGELAFGTVDSFLLWRLTGGVHATDVTNASRTLLFNLNNLQWDDELLDIFNIPEKLLPEISPSTADFGVIKHEFLQQAIPIAAIAGDQQAATVGQACQRPGMAKSTYGTGCFVLANTGEQPLISEHRLLSTVAYQTAKDCHYGLEGSIFVAGAAVQWLRDTLQLIGDAAETEKHALDVTDTGGVYFVPAFTGLGAPYWDPEARGAILGLNRDSGVAQIARAALEAVCYQTRDLLTTMKKDGITVTELRVDGGMVVNDWLVQFLADILQLPIARAKVIETTALGVAMLAGLQTGCFTSMTEAMQIAKIGRTFEPIMTFDQSKQLYSGWQAAVTRLFSSG